MTFWTSVYSPEDCLVRQFYYSQHRAIYNRQFIALEQCQRLSRSIARSRAYSKRVLRTNCALRIKKCGPRISSGIYFLNTS